MPLAMVIALEAQLTEALAQQRDALRPDRSWCLTRPRGTAAQLLQLARSPVPASRA